MLNFTGVDAIEFPNSPLKLEMYAQNDGFSMVSGQFIINP